MSGQSPPKPWERAGGAQTSTATAQTATSSTSTNIAGSSSDAPAIPQRPNSLSSVVNRTASNYSTTPGAATTAYNRPYSTYGGYGTSPYSRFGSSMYGNSMYGGYGSGLYGNSMYGGYGSGMYGGMYGGGMFGGPGPMPGDPNDPNQLTNHFAQSTQATFQIIESIVGAFGGFAQMLESTYMATHSSFFAMVSVAEQFANLRTTLGSILGIYTLARYVRTVIAKITGRPPPVDAASLTPNNFFAWSGEPIPPQLDAQGRPIPGTGSPPKPSKKPFIIFLLAVVGLPYLMGKLIKALARGQEENMRQQQQQGQIGPNGEIVPYNPNQQQQRQSLDPSKFDFGRVLYDYPPPEAVASGNFAANIDLEVKKGDLVAVLDKSGPEGENFSNTPIESQWWRCRARDGRMGWLPAVYLETIQRKPPPQQIEGQDSERSQTMPAKVADGRSSRVNTMTTAVASRAATMKGDQVINKGKDMSIETLQKAWANER